MKIKFLTPVQHDGESFRIGDVADLPDASATILFDIAAAEVVDAAADKAAAKAAAAAAKDEG